MPGRKRVCTGVYVFHVLNRVVARQQILDDDGDYAAFERVLAEALDRVPVRHLPHRLMPNHGYLVLWSKRGRDDDLSEFMRWMTVTQTPHWHAHHATSGTGPLRQGRFRLLPVPGDQDFLTVCCLLDAGGCTRRAWLGHLLKLGKEFLISATILMLE